MSVVAKFYVTNVERPEGSSTASKIDLAPVCRGVENSSWASATPGGSLTLWSLNDNATDYFERGQEYEIHFLQVAKPEPGDGHSVRAIKTKYGSYICATCGGAPQFDIIKYRYDNVPMEELDWTKHTEIYAANVTSLPGALDPTSSTSEG